MVETKNWVLWIILLVFISLVLLSQALFSSLEIMLGEESVERAFSTWGQILIPFLLIFFVGCILYFVRKKQLLRIPLFLFVSGVFIVSDMTGANTVEKAHLMFYFPLGACIYRIMRDRHIKIRVFLDILIILATVVFLDAVLKGFLVNRAYDISLDRNIIPVLIGFEGVLFGWICDLQGGVWIAGKDKRKRNYEGKRPFVDLHFYGRDFLYLIFFFGLFQLDIFITQMISNQDLVGRWRIPGIPSSAFRLGDDGSVRCITKEGLKIVGWFQMEGNLLDGFSLFISSDTRWAGKNCNALTPFMNEENTVSIKKDRVVFTTLQGNVWQRIP